MHSPSKSNAPINWISSSLLLLTPLAAIVLIPWYLLHHSLSLAAIISFFILLAWNGLSITAGYHRLWSHKAYEASWPVRIMLMLGGTMAVQNSILMWATGHRTHHRHVDDVERDPYSAKRGFWFSHIGWMLRDYPSGVADFENVPDLKRDKMVMWQHRHYVPLVLATNILIPLAIGVLVGDIWGVMLFGGLLRLIVNHHVTFFINSLAHMWGKQPYTDENTARDNPIVALLTWGEGYHNFHHIFQYDYRNGVKWWQFDPTKWLIYGLSKVGLTSGLRRVPQFLIEKSQAAMSYKYASRHLDVYGLSFKEDVSQLKQKVSTEYDAFLKTVQEWAEVKERAMELKKGELNLKLKEIDRKMKEEYHQLERRMHLHVKYMNSHLAALKKHRLKIKMA